MHGQLSDIAARKENRANHKGVRTEGETNAIDRENGAVMHLGGVFFLSLAFNFFWPDSDEGSAKNSSYPDRLKSTGFVLSAVLQISWQQCSSNP